MVRLQIEEFKDIESRLTEFEGIPAINLDNQYFKKYGTLNSLPLSRKMCVANAAELLISNIENKTELYNETKLEYFIEKQREKLRG